MSLVSSYVQAKDGLFYKNPQLSGKGWFICFDDDEPPELVIAINNVLSPEDIFKMCNIDVRVLKSKSKKYALRLFHGKFKSAKSIFFELLSPLDEEKITEHEGAFKYKEIGQGVIYGELS